MIWIDSLKPKGRDKDREKGREKEWAEVVGGCSMMAAIWCNCARSLGLAGVLSPGALS